MAEELPEPEVNLGQMMTPMLLMVGMLVLTMNETVRNTMAGVAGSVIGPAIPFSDELFVPTVFIIGSAIMIINTVFRSAFMDPVAQAHISHRMKMIRGMMMEARGSRDNVMIDKLQKMQMHIMPEQQKLQMSMMKPMMFTMVFIIGIFTWMYVLVEDFRVDHVSLPWNPKWSFHGKILFFPAWIAAYITTSAPLGRIVDRHIRLLRYRSHALVLAGELLPEPLAAYLKSGKAAEKKRGGNRKKSRDGPRKRAGAAAKTANEVAKSEAVEGLTCPACDGSDVTRASNGKMQCGLCLEEWRK